MSYHDALEHLVDDLVALLDDDALPDDDLAGARLAQQQTIVTIAGVYADLVATRRTTSTPTASRLAAHPTAALRELIDKPYPTFPDAPTPPPCSPAGLAWQRARGHATIAAHEWSTADPASWPTGDARWSAIADLAAVLETIGIVGPHPDPALALAAREVRRLAGLGPLPRPGRVAAVATKPVRVRQQLDLAPALHRLAQLLDRADHIDPGAVARIAEVIALTSSSLAAALTTARAGGSRAVPASMPDELRELERAIRPPAHGTRGLATALAAFTDPRPEAQATEIWRALNDGRIGVAGAIRRPELLALLPACRVLPVATGCLAATASRQFQTGRWLVPSFADELRWVTPAAYTETPGLIRRLHHAAAASAFLKRPPTAQPPAAAASDAMRVNALAGRLGEVVVRPTSPDSRPVVRL